MAIAKISADFVFFTPSGIPYLNHYLILEINKNHLSNSNPILLDFVKHLPSAAFTSI